MLGETAQGNLNAYRTTRSGALAPEGVKCNRGHRRVQSQLEVASGSSDSIRHHSWAYGSGTLPVRGERAGDVASWGCVLPAVATAGGCDYERDNEG